MKKSVIIASIIALAIIVWLGSGQLKKNSQENEKPVTSSDLNNENEDTKLPFFVETKTFKSVSRKAEIVLRGRTDSAREIDIKAETDGKIEKIYIKKGADVRKGQKLFKINMKDRDARLREAITLVEQKKLEYDVATKLKSKGHRSETKVAAAAAQLESAISRQKSIDLDIKNTIIKAPFNGFIEKKFVELGEVVNKNMIVAKLVDKDPFLVIGQISEKDVSKITVGDRAKAKLINGEIIDGFIRFISLTADSKTRTFTVEVQIPNLDGSLRAGLTAEIFMNTDNQQAHFLSPALLTLSDMGDLGVRTVNQENKVKFFRVKIVEDTEKGIWVTGLPENIQIITVGQDFVSDGEVVRIKLGNSNE